jgi:hypothetical protein
MTAMEACQSLRINRNEINVNSRHCPFICHFIPIFHLNSCHILYFHNMSQANENSKESTDSPATVSASSEDREEGLKRSASEISSSPCGEKRDKTDNSSQLDLAVTLGYKEGDRLEVQWEIENDNGEIEVHWWGATLLKHDGRTEDSVAIRQLLYDAYKDFEPSKEDVIFIGYDELASPDSQNQMKFRREGQEEVLWYNEGDLEQTLNGILMGAMTKNQNTWKTLPQAQQAAIAEKIAAKKEKLMAALRDHVGVITSETIQGLMQTALS